jgi:hypothetical protein
MKNILIDKKHLLSIIILAALTFGPQLLNRGLYWDDWTITKVSDEALKTQFLDTGVGYYSGVYHLHAFLQSTSDPIIYYRILAFVSTLLSTIAIFKILEKSFIFKGDELFISILFLTSPFFSTRITQICLPYTIFFSFFLWAFYLGLSENKISRLFSIILFFISFFVNSLIPFYLTFIIWLYFKNVQQNPRSFIIKNSSFLLVPILFIVFKILVLKTSGLHNIEGYNEITVRGIIMLPLNMFNSFINNYVYSFRLFFQVITDSILFIPLLIVLTSATYLIIKRFNSLEIGNTSIELLNGRLSIRKYQVILFTGILLFILSVFPYDLVNKSPSYFGFNTRNQLLLSIPYAICCLSILRMVINAKYFKIFFSVLIAGGMMLNIYFTSNFQKNHNKQNAIIEIIKQAPPSYTTIFVLDSSEIFNEGNLTSAHSFNALFKMATNEQKTLAITPTKYSQIIESLRTNNVFKNDTNDSTFFKHYSQLAGGEVMCMKDWQPNKFNCIMTIRNSNDVHLSSNITTLKLLYYEFFNPEKYSSIIRKSLAIEYTPI